MTHRQRHLIWNVGDCPDPGAAIPGLLTEHAPDVAVFSEAYYLRPLLASIKGYRLHQGRFGEARGVAVLVRKDLDLTRSWALRMKVPWIGPKLLHPHAPRTFQAVRYWDADRTPWRILGAHFPPGGPSGGIVTKGVNRAAWRESMRRARRFFANAGDDAAVVLGDINATAAELAPIAKRADADVVAGGKVDHALTRGVRHIKTERLGTFGGHGHQAILFTFQAD